MTSTFYDALYGRTVERWPAEDVVRFVESRRSELKGCRVLDLGCGSGRHAIYMAGRDLRVQGIDLSGVGVGHAREWAAREGLEIGFHEAEMSTLPFDDGEFDALVCWEAIFYGVDERVSAAIDEAFRVLAPKAPFLISLKSDGDYRTRECPRVGPSSHQTEQGLVMTFFNREQVERLFAERAAEVNIESLVRTLDNGRRARDNFVVTGRKAGRR